MLGRQLAGNYNSWCMAVSQTSDATGSYFRYALSSAANRDLEIVLASEGDRKPHVSRFCDRTITPGRRSIIEFHTRRASSSAVSLGTITVPLTLFFKSLVYDFSRVGILRTPFAISLNSICSKQKITRAVATADRRPSPHARVPSCPRLGSYSAAKTASILALNAIHRHIRSELR